MKKPPGKSMRRALIYRRGKTTIRMSTGDGFAVFVFHAGFPWAALPVKGAFGCRFALTVFPPYRSVGI